MLYASFSSHVHTGSVRVEFVRSNFVCLISFTCRSLGRLGECTIYRASVVPTPHTRSEILSLFRTTQTPVIWNSAIEVGLAMICCQRPPPHSEKVQKLERFFCRVLVSEEIVKQFSESFLLTTTAWPVSAPVGILVGLPCWSPSAFGGLKLLLVDYLLQHVPNFMLRLQNFVLESQRKTHVSFQPWMVPQGTSLRTHRTRDQFRAVWHSATRECWRMGLSGVICLISRKESVACRAE